MSMRSIGKSALQAVALLLALAATASPAPPEDIKSDKKKEKAIQTQIKDQEEKLRRAKETESSTLDALDQTNRKLHEKKQQLDEYRAKLRGTEDDIRRVSFEMASLGAKLAGHRRWMARKLQAMHRYGKYGDAVLILAGSEDIAGIARRWRYLENLARHERRMVEDYRTNLAALSAKELELQALRGRLSSEEEAVRRSERNLAEEKEQKQQILASVRQKRETYERMLRELNEAAEKLRKIIEESESKERFASKGLSGIKGQLPWPVAGEVAIPYGSQKDPKYNTPVFRNGIYISAAEGSRAKAVLGGRVDFANWFKGYGQLVIINHGGGYHTLYANLSEIFLKEGDIIEGRAEVGKVGDSSIIDKPSLYFEIRYKGKPLDPSQWLGKKK